MRVEAIELRLLDLELVEPFKTSYGSIERRSPILVRVFAENHEGWAECPADVAPAAAADPVPAAWEALETRLATKVLRLELDHPLTLNLDPRTPRTAAAALEMAVWDLYGKIAGLPLWHVLGGSNRPVPSGVVVGVSDSLTDLIAKVHRRLDEGYRRIKLKIKPGWDTLPIDAVRSRWPEVAISVDANGSYEPESAALGRFDEFRLQYIEQPFPADDLESHARLAESIATPICLDESLGNRTAVHSALARYPGFVINAKPARLGGFVETLAVHRLVTDAGAEMWCGGYLETGIGRAHLVALATLPGFTLPGDISASSRYWRRDLIEPPWSLTDGDLLPKSAPGIGTAVDEEFIERSTQRRIFLEV